MHQGEVDALADDAFVAGHRGADQLRRKFERGVVIELSFELVLWQLHAVAGHTREPNLERVAIGGDSAHVDRLPRLLHRRNDGLGREVERNAEHVGILDVEQPVLVEFVRLTPERATNHLLTEELRAERPHPQDVRHRVGVPAFGEHRDGDDTADLFADVNKRLDDGNRRFDEHAEANEREFQAIQETFVEVRTAVMDQFGSLRNEMNGRFERVDQRLDRVDRRFDRIEDKLDRALAPRMRPTPRRRGPSK